MQAEAASPSAPAPPVAYSGSSRPSSGRAPPPPPRPLPPRSGREGQTGGGEKGEGGSSDRGTTKQPAAVMGGFLGSLMGSMEETHKSVAGTAAGERAQPVRSHSHQIVLLWLAWRRCLVSADCRSVNDLFREDIVEQTTARCCKAWPARHRMRVTAGLFPPPLPRPFSNLSQRIPPD